MLLEVDAVASFYGDFQALFDVSVEVAEGETLAVIGANGAGKSTLLGTIAGLLRPRSGEVRFDGRAVDRLPPYRRAGLGIALVPEGRRVFPSLNVDENLRVGEHAGRKGPWTRKRVYELFPMLESLASRPGSVLSGGEQQAVAIGRALMSNPRLLLIDELSLGLAPIVVEGLYSRMNDIAREGTTVVLVEQDVSRALSTAGRAYCLLEGRVSLHGPTAELSRDRVTSAYFGGSA